MPEPLVHYIIPFIILGMLGISIKKAALFSLLAILPDIDVIFHIHRSFSHSIFFILFFAPPAIMITYNYYEPLFKDSIIATLVVLTHPFMDMFDNYTPVFWPLYSKSIHLVAECTTNMNNVFDLNFNFNILTKPILFYKTVEIDTHIFSSVGVGVSILLLTGLILKNLYLKPPSSQP